MPLINAYQCMLLIWIHDAYCTYYQLLMYATYVIDQRVVLSIHDASYTLRQPERSAQSVKA